MSKSYIATERDGTVHLIGPRKSALPKGAITRDHAASILLCAPDQLEGEIMALRTGLDTECRTKLIDGELFVHGDDCRKLGNAKLRGEHRRRRSSGPFFRRRSSGPFFRSRPQIELSDPGRATAAPSPQPNKAQAIKLADAAEQAGLSEEEMTTRLVGRARLKMHEGELFVSQADLNRMAKDGSIPKPSERGKTDRMLEQIEANAASDPETDRRTKAVAESIGVELGGESKRTTEQDRTASVAAAIGLDLDPMRKPDNGDQDQASGVTTAKAGDRKPYRLGAPKRWSECGA